MHIPALVLTCSSFPSSTQKEARVIFLIIFQNIVGHGSSKGASHVDACPMPSSTLTLHEKDPIPKWQPGRKVSLHTQVVSPIKHLIWISLFGSAPI